MAARIRARVAFHREPESPSLSPRREPAPLLPRPHPVAPARAAAPTRPSKSSSGARAAKSARPRSRNVDVREMPGAFGDAFRAIDALPGVTPLVSGVPYFYMRGAPPNNAGYYVDGVRVPALFHLGLGQSVIHPGLID